LFNSWFRLEIYVTSAEEHTLMRRFDKNGDGAISMEEFYNTLAEVYGQ
jgi:Ca2+-binding EF-hand superfamily protein